MIVMEELGIIQAQSCTLSGIENGDRRNDCSNKVGSNVIEENKKLSKSGGHGGGSSNNFHSWQHSSRIVRVSRASGGKDRHSKVMTSKGLRDRRIRLSVTTAIQFYDLQDRLGYDQPSKAVEWLIKAASDAISELPSLNNTFPETPKQQNDEKRGGEKCLDSADAEVDGDTNYHQQNQNQSQNLSLSKSACSSTSETSKGSGLSLSRSEIRVKARERARERAAKEKEKEKENDEPRSISHRHHQNNVMSIAQTASFTELLTGGISTGVPTTTSPTGSVHQNHRSEEPDLFSKAGRQQWSSTPMNYFSSGLLGPSSSSRTPHHPHHQSSGFQLGNSLAQAMSISPFVVKSETHSDQLQHISFIPDQNLNPSFSSSACCSTLTSEKGNDEERNRLMLSLHRIRDFIYLLLTYPVRTAHDIRIRSWARHASNCDHLTMDHLDRLLRDHPLRYFERLLPMEVMMKIEYGTCMFDDHKIGIPNVIFNLASDLAVHQLIQTLLSGDDDLRSIHQVMFYTRNGAERRQVFERVKMFLKEEDNRLRFHEIFHGLLSVDASTYQCQVEVHVLQEIARQLQLPMVKGSRDRLITMIKEETLRNKYLVLLVDGEGEETLNPQKVGFAKEAFAGVMVLISTESQNQVNRELAMDLKIWTKNHRFPWELFCHIAGNRLICSYNSPIRIIAESIVVECGGHLLALVLVAKFLENVKDVELWKFALHSLRRLYLPLSDIGIFHGQSRVMVNAFINLIWQNMKQTQKHCLVCCLFTPGIKDGKLHSELINDWISSLFIDAREAKHHLAELIDSSVLLQFTDNKCRYIQMPEEIYAILKSLNTQNPLFMKKHGLGLIEPPTIELWQSAVCIELGDNKFCELSSSPNCYELKVLMLQGNIDLMKIQHEFFLQMPMLCLIDLSYTSVRELPNSFFELQQLRELYLRNCVRFMKLAPEIRKLKKLEKLDLDGTWIIHLPEEVQELTNMQSMTLCFYEYRGKKSKQYTCSTIIPSGVISMLKCLKHLSIDVNPNDERWHENVQVILPEILGLKFLHAVSLYIPQPELLKLIPASISELDFRFVVGRHMERIISGTPPSFEANFKRSDCSLKFVKGADIPSEMKKLIKHSKTLFLDRHMTIKNLSEFGIMNLQQLRVCILAECKEMQTIVEGRQWNIDNDMLSHLLYLCVSYMKNLRSIWEGPAPPRYFLGMLRSLTLQNCPKLRTIFTVDFVGNLSLLKELIVKECPKVSTLITDIDDGSSRQETNIFLPKLRNIMLVHLPELINISNGFQMGPSLEIIGIYDCPKLQSLSKMELWSQNLKIKGEIKWWEALKWSKVDWGKPERPSKFDDIFYSIHKENDIMTQLGVYNDDD